MVTTVLGACVADHVIERRGRVLCTASEVALFRNSREALLLLLLLPVQN
jgi:hypothetical protein